MGFFSHITKYPGQPIEEITERVVYKHILSIAPFLGGLFFLAIVSIFGVYFLGVYQDQLGTTIPASVVNLLGFLFIVILAFLFMATLWIWRRNKLIITNQHIVDIDQLGLFHRKVATLRLTEIQDISASISGPIQTLLQCGTIQIQTAGERENFTFDYIDEPYEVEQYILETRKKYQYHHHNGL